MFGSLISSLTDTKNSLEFKLTLFVIGAIVVLVIVNLLLDGIRKYIRGLDTAALGGILIWVGYKASGLAMISVVTKLLYLIGGTLLVVGLLVFILSKLFRRKRPAKQYGGAPMPEKHLAKDKDKTVDVQPAGDKTVDVQPVDGDQADPQ